MSQTVKVIVETGKDGFSCFTSKDAALQGCAVIGSGHSVRATIKDFYSGVEDVKAFYQEEGKTFPDVSFHFVFDVGAFFNYYPINVTEFAKYIGMNPSLLRQYTSGVKVPKEKSLKKIREGIKLLASDLGKGCLIERPILNTI